MSALTSELEALLTELRELRGYKAENDKFVKSLERKLESSEKTVRRLREKVATLEARPCVLDGVDEDWLWATNAEIQFKWQFGGGRKISIFPQGRKATRRHAPEGQPLLKQAVEEASGRARGRASSEAQDASQA